MGTFNDPPPTPPDEHRMLDRNRKMTHPYAIEESSITSYNFYLNPRENVSKVSLLQGF